MPFRILAGLVCLVFIAIVVLDPEAAAKDFFSDGFNLVGFFVVVPVFAYSCLFGKLPDALVERLPEEIYDDFLHAEKNFTQFNVQSIVTALVALTIGMFYVFRQ
jgi:hypothetical protein